MADLYWELGQAQNEAELEAAKAAGALIGFRHRNGLAVPLHTTIRRMDPVSESADGRISERREMEMLLPTQPPAWSGASGFSGGTGVSACSGTSRSIATGDEVIWPAISGARFWVNEQITTTNHGHTWVVIATTNRTQMGGARS